MCSVNFSEANNRWNYNFFRFGSINTDHFKEAVSFVLGSDNKEFKNMAAAVRINNNDVFYFHPPPPSEKLPALMEGFVRYLNINEFQQTHLIRAAAVTKLIFVSIIDSNGRLSRAILNGILRQQNYPFITIRVEEEEKYAKFKLDNF